MATVRLMRRRNSKELQRKPWIVGPPIYQTSLAGEMPDYVPVAHANTIKLTRSNPLYLETCPTKRNFKCVSEYRDNSTFLDAQGSLWDFLTTSSCKRMPHGCQRCNPHESWWHANTYHSPLAFYRVKANDSCQENLDLQLRKWKRKGVHIRCSQVDTSTHAWRRHTP